MTRVIPRFCTFFQGNSHKTRIFLEIIFSVLYAFRVFDLPLLKTSFCICYFFCRRRTLLSLLASALKSLIACCALVETTGCRFSRLINRCIRFGFTFSPAFSEETVPDCDNNLGKRVAINAKISASFGSGPKTYRMAW